MDYPPPPTAPLELTVDGGTADAVLIVLGAVGAVAVVWSLVQWLRTGSPLPFAVLLGGLATVMLEPFADVCGLVWFPEDDQVHAFTSMGVPIPMFVVMGYLCLFGMMTWATVLFMERGPSKRQYWRFTAGTLITATVFEWVLLTTDVYVYYGDNQPLEVLGYPLYWMTINSGACSLAALVIYSFRRFFTGPRAFVAIAITPTADGAVMLATGWPAFAAIHSDLPKGVIHLCGLVTIGLGLYLRWAIAEVCCPGGRWYRAPDGEATPQEASSLVG